MLFTSSVGHSENKFCNKKYLIIIATSYLSSVLSRVVGDMGASRTLAAEKQELAEADRRARYP